MRKRGIKLEINHRKKKKKIEKTNYMETKQHAIKKTNGSTMKSKKFCEKNDNENTTI